MKCSVFATIATANAWNDLLGLLFSLSKNHPNSDLYVFCDNEIERQILKLSEYLSLTIHATTSLEEFAGKNRAIMEAEGSWLDFMMAKADVMLKALEKNDNVLFLDCDVVVLKTIYIDERNEPDVALSPHFIRQEFVDKYGYFNGGIFWSKSVKAVHRWKALMPTSRYYDQACLEDIAKEFRCLHLDQTYNLSWWRIYQSDRRPGDELNRLTINETGDICLDDRQVRLVHTHFLVQEGTIASFNREMLRLTMRSNHTWLKVLLLRLMRGVFEVYLPSQPRSGLWNHTNDSFRELADLWQESGLCRVHVVDENHCWFGYIGGVALYDRPTFEWWDRQVAEADMVLCGNVRPNNEKCRPWIFWPRAPGEYNKQRKRLLRKLPKTNETVFIGNVETATQDKYRNSKDWSSAITNYSLVNSGKHIFSQEEYLERLASSRFGLCLRGYGAKCHREVELLGLGVVPIVTREVDVNSYVTPLIAGTHYLCAETPEEVADITELREHERAKLATNCIQWYEKHCSIEGSFFSTLNVIFK